MLPFVLYLRLAFVIWMTVDAVRRQAEWYWFLILWLVPLGVWIYFFLVYLPARNASAADRSARSRGGWIPGGQVAALRRALDELRSVDRILALAEALLERHEVPEAVSLAEEAYALDPNHKRAAFTLGAACLASGEFARAERVLAPLVALEPGYRDHEARYFLAEVRWRSGQREAALATSRELAHTTRRLPHRAAYARYLHEEGRLREARLELEEALAENAAAPAHVRRRYRDAEAEAKRRLADLRRAEG